MESRIKSTLRVLPKQTQETLPFCDSYGSEYPAATDGWLAELSKKESKEQCQLLNSALDDLLVHICEPKVHLVLAEKIRYATINCVDFFIKKHHVNSIEFDPVQQDYFDMCVSLYHKIILLYRSVSEHSSDSKQVQSFALHRAISHSTQAILFYSLLYRPVDHGIWLEQHHLFQLARQLKLTDYSQPDSYNSSNNNNNNNKELSIANLYKRSLLLSRSRANKLTNEDIRRIWQALAHWAPHSKLRKISGLQTFFAVNLTADQGLHYASPDPDREIKGVFGLDCRILSAHLKKLKEPPGKSGSIPPELITHLISAWARISKRQHSRVPDNSFCKISYGSSSAHYFLSNEQDFNDLIAPFSDTSTSGKQTFGAKENDVWSGAHDVSQEKSSSDHNSPIIHFSGQPNQIKDRYQTADCRVINSSDSGYCLEGSLPATQKINIGDPVIIQVAEQSLWILSVLRWIEIISGNKLRLGLEKLSSQAEPCAIALIHKTQGTILFQRGFLLPDQPAMGQHASLIMSGLTAKPGMKFKLLHQEIVKKGQLDKCISSTSIYSEFQYHLFGQ